MRGGLVLGLTFLLTACAQQTLPPVSPPLALFKAGEVTRVDDAYCKDAAANKNSAAFCAYGWRPVKQIAASDQAAETYQLFWARAAAPLVTVRIARLPDGTGAIWVTRYENGPDGMRDSKDGTAVNLLTAAELAPLAAHVQASRFWTLAQPAARPAPEGQSGCAERARWILEGVKKADRRAVSTANCDGDGQWVIALGTDMLTLAKEKIPGLTLDPIY
jgi:hypothetical protein